MKTHLAGSMLPQANKALHIRVLCGWSRSIKGSQKVMHLAVFLKPPGVGEVGTLRVSILECATRLGTLNSKTPGLSKVA